MRENKGSKKEILEVAQRINEHPDVDWLLLFEALELVTDQAPDKELQHSLTTHLLAIQTKANDNDKTLIDYALDRFKN